MTKFDKFQALLLPVSGAILKYVFLMAGFLFGSFGNYEKGSWFLIGGLILYVWNKEDWKKYHDRRRSNQHPTDVGPESNRSSTK